LAAGFGFSITKSTENDQSYFGEKKKVHILSNCVIILYILYILNDRLRSEVESEMKIKANA